MAGIETDRQTDRQCSSQYFAILAAGKVIRDDEHSDWINNYEISINNKLARHTTIPRLLFMNSSNNWYSASPKSHLESSH